MKRHRCLLVCAKFYSLHIMVSKQHYVIPGFYSQVNVNSGGVVYFAIFRHNVIHDTRETEATAVLKFTPSSLVTQSERFGNELAKHLGVLCPQVQISSMNYYDFLVLIGVGSLPLTDGSKSLDIYIWSKFNLLKSMRSLHYAKFGFSYAFHVMCFYFMKDLVHL